MPATKLPRRRAPWVASLVLAAPALLPSWALAEPATTAAARAAAPTSEPAPAVEPAPAGSEVQGAYPVPPPPFSDGIFPCSECHRDLQPNLSRRPLSDAHEDITLAHGPRERWCFDCHHPDDRDLLRLASGARLPFTESYRLCGQCHGDKYRDWRKGAHGKRTGQWDGQKQYLLCAHCHNPHAPRFKPIAPMPPPTRPEDIR